MPRIKGLKTNQSQKYCSDTVLSKVNKEPGQGPNGDCWEWDGRKDPAGYGLSTYQVDGTTPGKKSPRGAHRVVYELLVGPIPKGLILMHSCDNPPCCNPAHLSPGTQLDNIRDRVSKGRCAVGEKYPGISITSEQVANIKLYILAGFPFAVITDLFNISRTVVQNIARGNSWKHVVVDINDPRILDLKIKLKTLPSEQRLTTEEVLKIRELSATGTPTGALATQFRRSDVTIRAIVGRKYWKEVKDPL